MRRWDVSKPAVSILCIAYNHEKYISQCIDGFLVQETTFPFRIIVHDDASEDNTAGIIREYERKYPRIIEAIIETENQYSKKDGSIMKIMKSHVVGKYVACCEGDDYWCDSFKLQRQYNFLEENDDYFAVGHLTRSIDAEGKEIQTFINSKAGEYTLLDNEKWQLFAHYSSYFYRNFYVFIDDEEYDKYLRVKCPGDRKYPTLFFRFGKLFVLPFVGSVYRFQSNLSSFTSMKENAGLIQWWIEVVSLRTYADEVGIKAKYYEREKNILAESILQFICRKDCESYLMIKEQRNSILALDLLNVSPILVKRLIKKTAHSVFYRER